MKNEYIKNKISIMNKDTQNVLELILGDAVLEIQHRKRINEYVLERIVLVYIFLFSEM